MKKPPGFTSLLVLVTAALLVLSGLMITETSAGQPPRAGFTTGVGAVYVEPGQSQLIVIDSLASNVPDASTMKRYLITIGLSADEPTLTSLKVAAGLKNSPDSAVVLLTIFQNSDLSAFPTDPPSSTTGSVTIGPILAGAVSVRVTRDSGASTPVFGNINAYIEILEK